MKLFRKGCSMGSGSATEGEEGDDLISRTRAGAEDGYVISPAFERTVILHLARNSMSNLPVSAPLMLGIQGPPGEGKTFQCEKILSRLGVESFLISGGQLESFEAGRPAELIRSTYLRAGLTLGNGRQLVAMVLNDIDTSIGDWGELVQYTVNRQAVVGELMHLADYPTVINGKKTRRVPIIFTGNDFTKLYGPLIRLGRMKIFTWMPSFDEKLPVVANMMPHLKLSEVRELMERLCENAGEIRPGTDLPISFYSGLVGEIYDKIVWDAIEVEGFAGFFERVSSGEEPVLDESVPLEEMVALGVGLVRESLARNYLNQGSLSLSLSREGQTDG